ncbi:hypothetical protein [Epibacterium ulvae]|uniref:hypothetical protein n=1 Tax=Epibacterium ulvae TaxID=1156985 RepID=UPI0024935104|nr:hypothetical protein [Epibacterium ulvae]
MSNRFIGVFSIGLLILLINPLAASAVFAASQAPNGCEILQQRASEICKAKVSCAGEQAAITALMPLVQHCVSSERPVPSQRRVHQLLSGFTSDLYFQCCIGNAIFPQLSSSSQE